MINIPGYGKARPSYFPKSERIAHHTSQAFGEHGEIILVDLPDEDIVEHVNSFKDEVGLKNILRQLIKSGEDMSSLAYDEEKDAQDVTGVQVHNLAELGMVVEAGNAASAKALADLNKALGTNLTAEELEKMYTEGTFTEFLKNLQKPAEGGAE